MVLERTYTVPLRREYLKVAPHKRTPKAQKALVAFLQKHMKTDTVKIGQHLNEELWKHGIKNPPHHVKVFVVKEDDGIAYAELEGFMYEKKTTKVEPKKEKGKLQQMIEKLGGKEGKKEDTEQEKAAEQETKEATQATPDMVASEPKSAKKEKQTQGEKTEDAKAEKQAEQLEETKELADKKKTHKAGKSSEPKKKKEEEQ